MEENIEKVVEKEKAEAEIASAKTTLQEKIDALTPEERERLFASLKILGETLVNRIELPQAKIAHELAEALQESVTSIQNMAKGIAKALAALDLSTIVDRITNPKRGNEHYKGLEIEKYRKIRKIKAKDLSDALGIDKSTLSKYSSGTIDVPASKVIEISEILNVSLDLLLKMKNRELRAGYIGTELYLYDFDYKKKDYVPTSIM